MVGLFSLSLTSRFLADERRRMEELQRNIHLHLVSDWICPPATISVSSCQFAVLQLHKSSIQHWGFSFSLKHNKTTEESGCSVSVDRVPSLLGTPLSAQVTLHFLQLRAIHFDFEFFVSGSAGARRVIKQHVK